MLRFFLGFVLVASLNPLVAQELAAARRECRGTMSRDQITGLTPQGDLQLASGSLVYLSGIRFPDDNPARLDAFSGLRARIGQPLTVQIMGERDRWNRFPARVALADGSTTLDLSEGLVMAGLALVDPGSTPVFCQQALFGMEQTARERGLGLWAGDRYKPVDALAAERLREKIDTFVLVEGRVRNAGERQQQTYLNFGGNWAEDFTIVIPKKVWTLMAERGLTAKALRGARIRARGILENWQGTALTITVPDMIERIADEGSRY